MRRLVLFCCSIGLALSLCSTARARDPRLLIVVMDKVTWQDLRAEGVEAPAFWELARRSAVGAMCVRTAAGIEGGGGYLTLGAGARATVGLSRLRERDLEGYALNADELADGVGARAAFGSYTGWSADDNRIVHLGIGELLQQNLGLGYSLRLGLLGETLRRAGLRVACVGNADTAHSLHREIAAIGMDAEGRVALGDVGPRLRTRSSSLPYAYSTDVTRLCAAFDRVASRAQVVIVDLGETSRAEEYAGWMLPAQAERARARAIAQADRTLAALLRRAPRETWSVLLLSPTAPAPTAGRPFAALTPVIFASPGGESALLTSPSTRRAGLVVNTDVAATVLDYFGLPAPSDTAGRSLLAEPTRVDAVASLTEYLERNDTLEFTRPLVFRSFAVFSALVLWLSVALLILGEHAPGWSRSLTRGLLLVCLAAPSAALLVAIYPDPISRVQLGAALVLSALTIAFLLAASTGWRDGDGALSGIVVILLAVDLVIAQPMLQWSTLSYSAAAGARFYGLGNEYGGALLGGGLVAAAAVLRGRAGDSRAWRTLIALILFALAAAAGWPQLGANLGISLSCAVGAAVFATYLLRHRFSWVDGVAIAVAVCGLAALVFAVDAFLTKGQAASHLGLLLKAVKAQGLSPLIDAVVRKLSMNAMLLRTSLWTDLALAALAVLVAAVVVRPLALAPALRTRPWMTPAVVSCLIGASAALVLNDSGILAAAMALLYGAGAVAYLGLGQVELPRPAPNPGAGDHRTTAAAAPD